MMLVPVEGEQRWGNKDAETWLNCTKLCLSYKKYKNLCCSLWVGRRGRELDHRPLNRSNVQKKGLQFGSGGDSSG